MRKALTAAIIVLLTLFCSQALHAAEDDLFDTKAAADLQDQGARLLNAKKYDAAIAAFEKAVDASPDADAYYMLGYAYYLKARATGDADSREKAKENFDQAYQINPNFSPNKAAAALSAQEPAQSGEQSTLGSAAPAAKQEAPQQPTTQPTATPAEQ